jgi:hypothetical protein
VRSAGIAKSIVFCENIVFCVFSQGQCSKFYTSSPQHTCMSVYSRVSTTYLMLDSCHESQWVYGVSNLYAYTTSAYLISSEGPSPLGLRTFFYNSTFLNIHDHDW